MLFATSSPKTPNSRGLGEHRGLPETSSLMPSLLVLADPVRKPEEPGVDGDDEEEAEEEPEDADGGRLAGSPCLQEQRQLHHCPASSARGLVGHFSPTSCCSSVTHQWMR